MSNLTIPSPVRQTDSPFQWNAGAWFGSQIGCSIWLLAGALVLSRAASAIALLWLGGFLICAATTIFLWSQRRRMTAYTAYQMSLLLITVVAITCIAIAHASGQLQRLVWGNQNAVYATYSALLVFPGLMVRFYQRERAAQRTDD